MVKRKKKKKISIKPKVAYKSNDTENIEDSEFYKTGDSYFDRKSTNWKRDTHTTLDDDEIDTENDATSTTIGRTPWDLMSELIIKGKINKILFFIAILVMITFTLYQDNVSGSLTSFKDLLWSLSKCSSFCFLVFIIYMLIIFFTWLSKKVRK